jgi:glycosidase
MLATSLHFLKGTPYIYQGEEIAMSNVKFDAIEDYKDIETLNLYKERIESGVSHESMMDGIHKNGRDNARTPMHWDNSRNAGFTDGKPWIKLNPNYSEINVDAAQQDSNSVFYHYQKLIQLRKRHDVIVYGEFQPLFETHQQLFAYERVLGEQRVIVINNFSAEQIETELPESLIGVSGQCLISNYEDHQTLGEKLSLAPYESFAIAVNLS